jgi:hypothetical protein
VSTQATAAIAAAPTPPTKSSVILEPVQRKRAATLRAGLSTSMVDKTSWTKERKKRS